MKTEHHIGSKFPVIHAKVWFSTLGPTHYHRFGSKGDSRRTNSSISGGDYKISYDWIIFRVLILILEIDGDEIIFRVLILNLRIDYRA